MTSKVTISIPDELKEKLEKKIKEINFESIQDCVLYVLNQIVSENNFGMNSKREGNYPDEDEIALKKKLKDLGYT